MQINVDFWSSQKYQEFITYLRGFIQEDYAAFSSSIIPGISNICGIRVPQLRKLAKEIVKGDWRSFLQVAKDDTYEEKLLQGIVIGYVKTNIKETISLIENYVETIDNWAQCDSFCSSLKITKTNQKQMLGLIKRCLTSQEEYTIRFAVVMLLNYYIEDDYLEFIFDTLNSITAEKYYVKMAVAWAVSICFVKFPEETEKFLLNNFLDNFTYNKSIDKIIDSRRVESVVKKKLKTMKRRIDD